MFLFLRLCLAHMLGDFPFQTGEIFRLKTQGIWGQILHAQIVAFAAIVLSIPYLGHTSLWLFILFIASTHVTQDWIKIKVWNRRLNYFWSFTLDQTLHIAVIALVMFFPYAHLRPEHTVSLPPWLGWYWNDRVILYGVAYLMTTFQGIYHLDTLKRSYFKGHQGTFSMRKLDVRYGMCERAAITALTSGPYFLFSPLILLCRLPFARFRMPWIDAPLNLIYGGVIGFALQFLLA
jgi:hypothetical protein